MQKSFKIFKSLIRDIIKEEMSQKERENLLLNIERRGWTDEYRKLAATNKEWHELLVVPPDVQTLYRGLQFVNMEEILGMETPPEQGKTSISYSPSKKMDAWTVDEEYAVHYATGKPYPWSALMVLHLTPQVRDKFILNPHSDLMWFDEDIHPRIDHGQTFYSDTTPLQVEIVWTKGKSTGMMRGPRRNVANTLLSLI